MNSKKVGVYAGMGVLAFALLYGASTQIDKNYNDAEYGLEAMIDKEGIEYAAPEGYHLEGDKKAVRNSRNLVDASFVPEEGYHLEEYEYDENLFYVIQDGFHNENGYLVKDGYHLEGNKIEKDYYSMTLKIK